MDAEPTYEQLLEKVKSLEKDSAELSRVKSELEQNREALRQNREHYQQLLENLNTVLYTLDANARITYVSSNVKRLAGYSRQEMIGRKFIDFVHPDDLAGRLEKFKEILSGKESVTEYRYLTKSGEYKWVMNNARLLYENGEKPGIQGILVDITQRRQAEEENRKLQKQMLQSQMMEALGRLAGGVAHEFNNLFQILQGNIEFIEMDKPDDHPDKDRLVKIQKELKRGAGLINQLLLFSRRDPNQSRKQMVFINEHLKATAKFLAQTILKRINVNLSLADVALVVCADPDMITQVLINLATNAADVMPEGGDMVIRTRSVFIENPYATDPGLKPGSYVLMTVSDTGPGMDEETAAQVFDPFFTTKQIGKGTGLGLAAVYGILREHGGSVTCTSTHGKGTTFRIYWPASEYEGSF